ncbi:CBS domain-containing protein [Paucidesulfovibrio longus]|uniref:CBS domain-containing protein n=1 Tax=Paucidesulfovibrio longus TaxID=889 RepID=UPI0003B445A4|nr:CBS domain-containing protein [Paucidesulfovibrio longus]
MLVRYWMTDKPMTLGRNENVVAAAEVMRAQHIRQFPVVEKDGTVVGILSDRDIRDAMPSKYLPGGMAAEQGHGLADLKVDSIMTEDPLCVSPETAMDTVADLLAKHKVGALPVTDAAGKLVGIITEVDVFRFLVSATGLARGGAQFAFRLEAKPGPLASLLEDLRAQNVHFSSVLTSHDLQQAGYRHAYIRVEHMGDHSLGSLVAYLSGEHDLIYYILDGQVTCLDD